MKKIIFLLAISVCCFRLAGLSQVRVGVEGGVSIANLEGVEGDGKGGLMIGVLLDAPIKKGKFSFHPSISYVQKGQTETPPGVVDKQYLALRYMEVDADFLYNIDGFGGGAFFLGAGPSIAFNLPSKRVSITDDVKSESTIKFGKEPINNMRGTDWGANFRAGFRTGGGFLFSVNYNKGLRNLVTEGSPGTLKTWYIGVQLGVFLNNGKASQ